MYLNLRWDIGNHLGLGVYVAKAKAHAADLLEDLLDTPIWLCPDAMVTNPELLHVIEQPCCSSQI